eukprot:4483251-Prorocentrum_lima.AAC.1
MFGLLRMREAQCPAVVSTCLDHMDPSKHVAAFFSPVVAAGRGQCGVKETDMLGKVVENKN